MATRFYGFDRGDAFVTKDSSTTSKEIELAVDDANGITQLELQAALEKVRKAVIEDEGFTNS